MKRYLPLVLLLFGACASSNDFAKPAIDWAPLHYVCHRAAPPPVIDGKLDDEAWKRAPWTSLFVDIEGDLEPRPTLKTRAKMLWDAKYFYIAADLVEPHVWATLTKRDSVIFHDNDFEVFIDPDGDTHQYYELEINAYGTEWDLRLPKPYRDDGHAIDEWDITGLKTAIHVDGTLNEPRDSDRGWSVEIAIPWDVMAEFANRPSPPKPGDSWRVNFSRVQWRTRIVNGRYEKTKDPENNWVWSPQGLINMHYPEMWGFVTFAGASGKVAPFAYGPAERAKWNLRRTYYAWKAGEIEGDAKFYAEERLPDGRMVTIDHEGRTRVLPKERD